MAPFVSLSLSVSLWKFSREKEKSPERVFFFIELKYLRSVSRIRRIIRSKDCQKFDVRQTLDAVELCSFDSPILCAKRAAKYAQSFGQDSRVLRIYRACTGTPTMDRNYERPGHESFDRLFLLTSEMDLGFPKLKFFIVPSQSSRALLYISPTMDSIHSVLCPLLLYASFSY